MIDLKMKTKNEVMVQKEIWTHFTNDFLLTIKSNGINPCYDSISMYIDHKNFGTCYKKTMCKVCIDHFVIILVRI